MQIHLTSQDAEILMSILAYAQMNKRMIPLVKDRDCDRVIQTIHAQYIQLAANRICQENIEKLTNETQSKLLNPGTLAHLPAQI